MGYRGFGNSVAALLPAGQPVETGCSDSMGGRKPAHWCTRALVRFPGIMPGKRHRLDPDDTRRVTVVSSSPAVEFGLWTSTYGRHVPLCRGNVRTVMLRSRRIGVFSMSHRVTPPTASSPPTAVEWYRPVHTEGRWRTKSRPGAVSPTLSTSSRDPPPAQLGASDHPRQGDAGLTSARLPASGRRGRRRPPHLALWLSQGCVNEPLMWPPHVEPCANTSQKDHPRLRLVTRFLPAGLCSRRHLQAATATTRHGELCRSPSPRSRYVHAASAGTPWPPQAQCGSGTCQDGAHPTSTYIQAIKILYPATRRNFESLGPPSSQAR